MSREVEPDQRPQQDEPDLSSLVDSFDSFFTRREVEPDQRPQQADPDLLRLRLVNRDDPDFRSLVDSFFTRLPQQDEPRS
jgi:hypothetical protein